MIRSPAARRSETGVFVFNFTEAAFAGITIILPVAGFRALRSGRQGWGVEKIVTTPGTVITRPTFGPVLNAL